MTSVPNCVASADRSRSCAALCRPPAPPRVVRRAPHDCPRSAFYCPAYPPPPGRDGRVGEQTPPAHPQLTAGPLGLLGVGSNAAAKSLSWPLSLGRLRPEAAFAGVALILPPRAWPSGTGCTGGGRRPPAEPRDAHDHSDQDARSCHEDIHRPPSQRGQGPRAAQQCLKGNICRQTMRNPA